jgi:hypothetical protein
MTVYFQVTLAEAGGARDARLGDGAGRRGLGVSHITTPLIMGLMADLHGIASGFYVLGVASLVVVGLVALLRNWAFARTRLAAGAAA